MTIPPPYNTLAGFKTVYSETELFLAIALCESLIANGLGTGVPGNISTLAEQEIQSDLLTSLQIDTAAASGDTATIRTQLSGIQSDVADIRNLVISIEASESALATLIGQTVQVASGVVTSTAAQTIVPANPNARIYIVEVTLQNETNASKVVLLNDTGGTLISRVYLAPDADITRTYSIGREIPVVPTRGITLTCNTAAAWNYTIGWYSVPFP